MGRWTQYDEDAYRLPEGVTRVGYDADTGRYTFRDHTGRFYDGSPSGEQYDTMPTAEHLFENDFADRPPYTRPAVGLPLTTFHDTLDPSLIASPAPCSRSRSRRLVDAVRRVAILKILVYSSAFRIFCARHARKKKSRGDSALTKSRDEP